MNNDQFKRIIEWRKKAFPSDTRFSLITFLQEEVAELRTSLYVDEQSVSKDLAGCIVILYELAERCGMTFDDVDKAIEAKIKFNENWDGKLKSEL